MTPICRLDPIHLAPTPEPSTEPGGFARALRAAAQGVASAVQLAAPFVPGGTLLSAAIRGATSSFARAVGTGSGGAEGSLLDATRSLQRESQEFNLRYLQLQESMQRESREFTALSNVMKVKHDSAKAAILNIH